MIRLFTTIARFWRDRQRRIDMKILWPACRDQTDSLDDARSAFLTHCLNDHAWRRDYSVAQIDEFVGRLR